jgi:hypothetical protein
LRGKFTERSIYSAEHSKNFGIEISPEKSETMAFLVEDPVRCKIIVGNKCLQQVRNFKYLGCEISYENENDIQQKKQFHTVITVHFYELK